MYAIRSYYDEYTVPGIYSVTLTVKNKQGCEHSMTQTNIVEAKNSGYVKMPVITSYSIHYTKLYDWILSILLAFFALALLKLR